MKFYANVKTLIHVRYWMKKSLAIWMTLCMCLLWTQPCTLAEVSSSSQIIDNTKEVKLDVSWGALSFTYADSYELWNPDTHKYDQLVSQAWTAVGNWIKMENTGRNTVKATFSVELNASTVQYTFKEAQTATSGQTEVTAELDAGESRILWLELSGAIDKGYSLLGSINIEILAK